MKPSTEIEKIDWRDFVDKCLEEAKGLPFAVEYQSLTRLAPSAITYVSNGLFERAISMGLPGIVISVCDYTSEMLSFSFARAVGNVLAGSPTWDFKQTFPEKSQQVVAGKLIAEYRGVEDYGDGFGLRIKLKQPQGSKNGRAITNIVPLQSLPAIQPAPPDAKPMTARKMTPKEVQADFSRLPNKASELIERNPSVSKSVVLATSSSPYANIPPTMLTHAILHFEDGYTSINDCLITGRLVEGELKTRYSYPAEGVPSLLATSRTREGFADLFAVYDYLEEGGNIDLLAIEAPTSECLDSNRGYIEDIISEFEVPIIVFCEESVLRHTTLFSDLGLPIFIWGKSQIEAVDEAAKRFGLAITQREHNAAYAIKRAYAVEDTGEIAQIASVLYSLLEDRDRLSNKDESSFLALLNILGQTLKRTEVLIKAESEHYWTRIDNAVASLTNISLTLSEPEINELQKACKMLKSLCRPDFALPKEEEVFNKIAHAVINAGHRVCLIVSRGTSETAALDYWQTTLDEMSIPRHFIRVVTPRTFLKQQCTPSDEEVFISGWFRREEMERLLESGLSSIYSVFLYKSCDKTELENRWFAKANDYWKAHHAAQRKRADQGLERLHIAPPVASNPDNKPVARIEDDSLPGLARSITKHYAHNQAASYGETLCEGRLVCFSNGMRRWLRINDSGGDTLLVVNDTFDEDEGVVTYSRKTASALQEDDIVLKTDADGDAISEACKEFGSYEATLAKARLWYEPIEQAKNTYSRAAIIRRIQQAGCKRNRLTIANWVDGKTRIAPSEMGDIECIGKAFGYEFNRKQLGEITTAAAIIVGDRISGGRKLAKDIAEVFVHEAQSCGSLEGALTVFREKHSDLGEIELLYVDYVGAPETVPVSRFGYYTD